jgi:toxin FitB
MNLVDSCGWIEYFSGSAYADFYAEAIEDTSNLIVPVICIMEVFKKIYSQRDENSALVAAAHMRQGTVIPLTESIALTAASFGIEKKLPLADSIIYATGTISNAEIFTQDSHFEDLKNVRFLTIES